MTDDTKMSDAKASEATIVAPVLTETPPPPPPPPLVLAALRLEKILSDHGNNHTTTTSTNGTGSTNYESYYMNPIKVVRRWLGTSSGATSSSSSSSSGSSNTTDGHRGGITIQDIQTATRLLFDPTSIDCVQQGRTLLLSNDLVSSLSSNPNTHMDTMQTDDDAMKVVVATTDDVSSKSRNDDNHFLTIASAREIECWLFSLMIRALLFHQPSQSHQFVTAMTFANSAILISTSHLNSSNIDTATTTPTPPVKSSLYPFIGRLYRFAALAYESYATTSTTTTSAAQRTMLSSDMLSTMSKAHTLATVRRDVDTQTTILNIMLRELLRHAQVEQAHTLLSNTKFPDEMASNNQYCRYLYYSGRIYALRLEYTTAYANLSQCLRKLPHNTGIGFRICVQRLVIVVQLLMGEIPDRQIFNMSEIRNELQPYLSITTAVRHGDLVVFEQVVTQHTRRLQLDGTYTLISRLAHQVVKAGLRKLHLSYSRLTLQDIATRLGLPSAKSAEYVVAKAVRDGVIDATIYHNEGYVESHDLIDVYATKEPAEAFHRRIAYCLTTHNDAVRGMRYPPDAYKKQLEASRGNRRKRNDDDNKTDEEKAKELEEEFDDDY